MRWIQSRNFEKNWGLIWNKKTIIIVDDGSSDETFNLIQNYKFKSEHKIIKHKVNSGKGAAIKSSVNYILGDIVIIQDADLEYDPKDYKEVIFPIIKNKSKIVYGSRVLNKKGTIKQISYLILEFFVTIY